MTRTLGLALAVCLLVGAPARGLDDGLGKPPSDLDRSTPLATVQGFLNATHSGDYAQGAFYLWLDHIRDADQPKEGARLARRLRFVLDRELWVDLGALSREPEGDPGRPGYEQLGTLPLNKTHVPIRLTRYRVDNEPVWLFGRETVKAIDRLYDVYGPPLGDVLPEVFFTKPLQGLEVWQWMGLLLSAGAALLVGWLLEKVLLLVLARLSRMTRLGWDDKLVESARGPLRLPLWAMVLGIATPPLLLPPAWSHGLSVLNRSLLVIAASWFALRFLDFISGVMESRVAKAGDNVAMARAVRTQMAVLRRVVVVVVWILATAALLMQFTVVRTVGVSLLASAGVAGVVLGLAAQKSIGALLAGIQLSITQPIRIGDSVVVEGESGTVEEISLTYVVVRIWDLRRLIIPVTQFLEKPFQNWSKGGTDMLGTVFLQVDWTTDVDALRKELARVLATEGAGKWDGKTASIQVVDSSERTMQVRVLLGSTVDALFDLRCLVRERLIAFVRNRPEWLPQERVAGDGVQIREPEGARTAGSPAQR